MTSAHRSGAANLSDTARATVLVVDDDPFNRRMIVRGIEKYATPLIEQWDGNAWSITPGATIPALAGGALHGITCTTEIGCTVVGAASVSVQIHRPDTAGSDVDALGALLLDDCYRPVREDRHGRRVRRDDRPGVLRRLRDRRRR